MLHWQLLHWLKGLSLATRVGIFSSLGHLFLLFALFVVYKGNSVYNVTISSTMINTDAKIVYMPLHRSIKQAGSSGKAQATTVSTAQKKQTVAPSKQESGPSTTIVTRKNPKAVIPKNKKNSKTEKVKSKKPETKTPEVKKVIEEKKETVTPKIEPTPIEQKKIEEYKSESLQTADKIEVPDTKAIVVENSETSLPDQNIVYVGQAEMEALQLQEFIQNEMAAHWSPPMGIRSDAQCVVKIIVSHDGKNNQIILEQPSKILLFDSAAKRAATQLQPPQWAYGKEILVTFKP